jgi:uncharacterized protein YkwD
MRHISLAEVAELHRLVIEAAGGSILRTALCLFTLLVASAVSAQAPAAKSPAPEEVRRTFVELINAARQRQGLKPLALDPALVSAAQAHADDMTAHGYYDFKSPDGKEIEQWAAAAGYRHQLITEKITNETSSPQAMVEKWARRAEANRTSLFHPDVEDLGIGIGAHQGMPVYTFVVARSEGSYLADYTAKLFEKQTARFRDLDSLRRELIERINEARTEHGLLPLTGDPALDLAAQDYADDLFQGIKQGLNRPASGTSLARRVSLHHYLTEGFSGIGSAIVQGALSPEVTLAALLGNRIGGKSEVLGKGYRQIGIGLAFERKGDTFDVVWVQCLARPPVKN